MHMWDFQVEMELNAYFVKIDILIVTCSKHIFKGFCQMLGLLYNPFLCYYELQPTPPPQAREETPFWGENLV